MCERNAGMIVVGFIFSPLPRYFFSCVIFFFPFIFFFPPPALSLRSVRKEKGGKK